MNLRHRSALTALLTALLLALAAVPAAAGMRHHHHHHRHRHPAAVPASCANADAKAGSLSTSAIDAAVVCLVDQQRAQRGLPALRASAQLDRSAQSWTDAMVSHEIFTHGANFAARISAVGINWSSVGENIATGFATPATVVTAWMASTDHCQNILDPDYSEVGTGVNPHPVLSFGTGPATWTQDFALPSNQAAPSRNHAPAQGCPYRVSIP